MIKGSIVALVTPMLDSGEVCWDSLAKLVEMHVEAGTAAIVSMGTTGESATLDHAEHIAVVKKTVELAANRIPIIAGTGANSTSEAISLTAAAKAAGVQMCLLVSPYYNKPTQEGLYLHHKAIAEAVDIPQLLYNVPGRTAVDMSVETIVRLSSVKNIAGVKEATGELERIEQIKAQVHDDFAIYSGDDATARLAIAAGAHGDISVTANIAPRKMQAMMVAALSGDAHSAKSLDNDLAALHRDLFVESNPIPVKWALQDMGLIPRGTRLPLTALADEHHATVRAAITAAGE